MELTEGSIIKVLPGGEKLLWGGTRRGVKLSRPVEAGTLFDPDKTKCPFHRDDEKSLAEYHNGEIRVLSNVFTPHKNHRLVIARDCSDEWFVRTLGGPEFLATCMEAIGTIASHDGEELALGVHVLRGQNVPHLHWHVYGYWKEEELDLARETEWTRPEENPDLFVISSENFSVVARGPKVGQLILIPSGGEPLSLLDHHAEVAGLLYDLVYRTNRAFVSTQGEMPRYTISGRCSADGKLRYFLYTPELQMLGCSDDLADLNGTARARTWSPKETAKYLVENILSSID